MHVWFINDTFEPHANMFTTKLKLLTFHFHGLRSQPSNREQGQSAPRSPRMVPGSLCFHPSHCLLRHRFAVGERGCGHPGEQQGRTGGWPCPFWMRNGILIIINIHIYIYTMYYIYRQDINISIRKQFPPKKNMFLSLSPIVLFHRS